MAIFKKYVPAEQKMLKTKIVLGEPCEKIEQVLSTIIILRLVIKILAQANAHQKNHAR